MNKILIFLIVGLLFTGLINCNSEFDQWMKKYKKNYKSQEEYEQRLKIFQENVKLIEKEKKRNLSYSVGLNKFSDLTKEEFLRKMGRITAPTTSSIQQNKIEENKDEEKYKTLPAKWDWRKLNAVTNVKDEGQECGASPYFSAVGGLEGGYAIATGVLTNFSAQQLISCDPNNDGCNGGFMTNSFDYVVSNGGLQSEQTYPYNGTSIPCTANPKENLVSIYGYQNVTNGDELALQYAVTTVGPISAAFYMSQYYSGGVYYDPTCPPGQATTGVLVVGYDTTQNGTDYWIGKLSFGSDFGIDGYIWLARNRNNNCGIASYASFPTGVHKTRN